MNKKNTLYAFFLALAITVMWTSFNRYEYVGNNVFLFNQINVFPLVLWTLGLTLLYGIHINLKTRYPFFHAIAIYLIGLGIIEAVGYHVLNIRLNSDYPSLFGLGIIHAPLHMKIFYIVAGPVYICITGLLFKQKRK